MAYAIGAVAALLAFTSVTLFGLGRRRLIWPVLALILLDVVALLVWLVVGLGHGAAS